MTELDDERSRWVAGFRAGRREVMEELYRDHLSAVLRAAGTVVSGVDQEIVAHEVFYRLLTSETMRESYAGGSMSAWLSTIARNQAIDLLRRQRREVPLSEATEPERVEAPTALVDEAKQIVDRFRAEVLPAKWAAVFDARFVRQLSQREAAAALGISRTTLAYQELRLRGLLEKFCFKLEKKS